MPGTFLNINPDHALTVGWLIKMSVGFEIESSDKTEEKDFLKQTKLKIGKTALGVRVEIIMTKKRKNTGFY